MICEQCGANCPDEQRERFARACWLATKDGTALPDCESFVEQYWRGSWPRRKSVKCRQGVRYGQQRA